MSMPQPSVMIMSHTCAACCIMCQEEACNKSYTYQRVRATGLPGAVADPALYQHGQGGQNLWNFGVRRMPVAHSLAHHWSSLPGEYWYVLTVVLLDSDTSWTRPRSAHRIQNRLSYVHSVLDCRPCIISSSSRGM
jgi:hypothetical protein